MGRAREREEEKEREEWKNQGGREGGKKKKRAGEGEHFCIVHSLFNVLLVCKNEESKSSTDSTPAVIPTLFDVEPRKERGIVMGRYEEKHLEINEYARRRKIDFRHGFCKYIIECISGVPRETQNKIPDST